MHRTLIFPFFAALLAAQPRPPATSHVMIADADGRNPREVYQADRILEAPNWSPDGKYLLLNSGGKLWKLPVGGGDLAPVDTGTIDKLNNDHGITRDGKWFAISAQQVYVLPSEGGAPRQLTNATPSYFHGWSPDGKTLAYTAKRGDNFDIYTIPFDSTDGKETRLTTHPALDDGPDYSPDGKWIYINSERSGYGDIYRIPATGAGENDALAERVTSDDYDDWFPHPSPDAKWLLFISFPKGTIGHPANKDVVLRRMPMPGKKVSPNPKIEEVVHLFGGQGTINVNSWSPDSKHFAYVTYTLLPAKP